MSVCLSVRVLPKSLRLSELLLSTIETIDHQAYQPSSLSTIEPIDHQAYQPSSLLTFKPINHWAYWPLLRLLSFLACFGVFLVELEILKPGIFWTLKSRLLSLYLNIVLKFLNSFQTFSRLMENFIEYNSWDWQNLQRKSPRGLMMYDYPLLCSEWSNLTWILNWFEACKLCYTYTWLALPSEWRWDIL